MLVLILLMHITGEAIVAARNQLRGRLNGMFAQVFLQQLICDATPPELIRFRRIFWPRRFLTAKLHRRVALEVDWLLQQFFYFRDPLINAFGVESVNFVGRFQCAK